MAQQTSDNYAMELRGIRAALKLTQAKMAAQLGVTPHSYARYEWGLRHVPEPTMRLARALHAARHA